MKNFILGCLFILLTAAGTASIMTVKPATPKATVVLTTNYDSDDIKNKIYPYLRKGYIVKSVAGTSQYGRDWIVVMEKY